MFQGEKTMRKLIISTIAAASLLGTVAVANAQFCYWHWVWTGFTWVWVCS
jgi:O-antigen/teichoic acid export membrane protein